MTLVNPRTTLSEGSVSFKLGVESPLEQRRDNRCTQSRAEHRCRKSEHEFRSICHCPRTLESARPDCLMLHAWGHSIAERPPTVSTFIGFIPPTNEYQSHFFPRITGYLTFAAR